MYTVVGALQSRAIRVIWMLEELGEAYEIDPKRPHDPAVFALNPSGKVPILIDGGEIVVDSTAILQYLADKHGKLTFKAGTIERAHQDSFTHFALDDLEGPLWTMAKHTFALPEEYRVEDAKRACEFDFERALKAFGTRLGSKAYVSGETFTVPDILIGHCLGWSLLYKWPLPEGPVSDYLARVRARPAYQKAMARRSAA